MNYSLVIARRLLRRKGEGRRLSGPVVRIATAAVALGVAIMILSVAIGMGFKREIRDRLIGFSTHIQISSDDFNVSYEMSPIDNDTSLLRKIREVEGVHHIQPFIIKPGIIKTKDAVQGVALKGVDGEFDWAYISSILEEGTTLQLSDTAKTDGIILSRTLANMLHLQLGDAVRMYFIQDGIRARKFSLTGIYNSHFSEFDKKMALVDIKQLAQLNGWDSTSVSGFEVQMEKIDNLEDISRRIDYIASMHIGPYDTFLRVQNIYQMQPQMFGWLSLLDTNIIVILVLIIAVASLNMISGLLILILENTNTIGLLKAMGSRNSKIRQVFIYMAVWIIGRGMIIGNMVGIALCLVQKYTGLVGLDPDNYYLDTVPILLEGSMLLYLNLGTLAVTTLMLVGPSYIVAKISPAKSIRFN